MAGRRNKKIRMPKHLLPSPRTIVKRGFYEMFSTATGGNTKPRDYGKRITKGKY